ncbi:hypothetical protein KR054_006374, partial [Drosophila jambulina]
DAVLYRFTNLVCLSYNKSWFIYNSCRLKAVSRDRVTMNVNGTIVQTIDNVQVHYQVLKKASGFKPWLLEGNIDVCRFLRRNYNPFARLVFNLFKEFTNFNSTCPLLGHQIIKGFYLRPELLGLPLPTGEYMLALGWFFNRKLIFDTNVSFVFVEDLRKS